MIRVIIPERISLNDWAAALVYDYATENLPLLQDDESWQEWGTIVANTGVFLKASLPAPITYAKGEKKENYKEWDSWAKVVYTIMSDEYSIPQRN